MLDQILRPVRIGGWTSVEEDVDHQEAAVGRQNRLCRHPIGLCRGVYRTALRAQLPLAVLGARVGAEVVGAVGLEPVSCSTLGAISGRLRRFKIGRPSCRGRRETYG